MIREPSGAAGAEIVVRRSRFISEASPVTTVEQAEEQIVRVRVAHPDASHVVYAYLIGDPASERAGLTDAGEPKGTAGRPVMEILRGSGIRDVIITIVRYFGGTKLGTGGLVHAYGDAARAVLDRLPTRERIHRDIVRVDLGYDLAERVKLELSGECVLVREEYGTTVVLEWEIATTKIASVRQTIQDISRGNISLQVVSRAE